MEHQTSLYLFVSVLIIAVLVAYYFLGYKPQKQKAIKLIELKNQYDEALRGNDKTTALQLGRLYYGTLRDGQLSIYDEQAISNDLATMK